MRQRESRNTTNISKDGVVKEKIRIPNRTNEYLRSWSSLGSNLGVQNHVLITLGFTEYCKKCPVGNSLDVGRNSNVQKNVKHDVSLSPLQLTH